MKIIQDQNGRIGRITEDRGRCVFAVPYESADVIGGVMPGVGKAKFITATAWDLLPDGTYRGMWFDSPQGEFLTARKLSRPNHPNRSSRSPDAPVYTPAMVLAAREDAGHTQTEAAALVYRKLRTWQDWEGGKPIDPAVFELYLVKTGQLPI